MRAEIKLGGLLGPALYLVMCLSPAQAGPFLEDGDSGELPSTAQKLLAGTTSVSGDISFAGDVDLYEFDWAGGQLAVNTFDGPQLDDPQLFLFDGAGVGIGENDDSAGVSGQSEIALDLLAGSYFLGISVWNNDPLNSEGYDMFSVPTFDDLNGNSIESPVASGDAPLISWRTDSSDDVGSYNISFSSPVEGDSRQGERAVPEPSVLALLGIGLVGLGFAWRWLSR